MIERCSNYLLSHFLPELTGACGLAVVFLIKKLINKQGEKMLEGKEVDVKIGSIGNASVDITPDLYLEVALSARVDLFNEMLKLAKKTGTPLDDGAVKFIGGVFGRSEAEVLAAAAVA